MIRITKETEYAFLLISRLLESENQPFSTTALAEKTGIALPVTGKVLKRLVKEGILQSSRGAFGGYRLAVCPEEATALDIVHAMEGKPELVDCAHGAIDCALAPRCGISPFWRQINDDIVNMLASRTLADMRRAEQHKK